MSSIEANITISLPDGTDPSEYIQIIRDAISRITNKPTDIHVTETDDPLTTNNIGPR